MADAGRIEVRELLGPHAARWNTTVDAMMLVLDLVNDVVPKNPGLNVQAPALCYGVALTATRLWGMLAPAVFAYHGIRLPVDLGCVVYALIDADMLCKEPKDALSDFAAVDPADWANAFESLGLVDLRRTA